MRRRIVLIAVALIALLWGAGWFVLKDQAERNADRVLAKMAGRGIVLLCPDRKIGGFPFAFDVECGQIVAHDGRTGMRVAAGRSEIQAAAWHPASLVLDLGAPVILRDERDSEPTRLVWERARLQAGLGLRGARSADLDIEAGEGDVAGRQIAFSSLSAGIEPAGSGSAVSLRTDGLTIASRETRSAPIAGSFDADLSVPPHRLMAGRDLAAGLSARNVAIEAESGAISLSATGELTLDAEGLPSGSLMLRLVGLEGLPAFVQTLPREAQPLANSAAGALMAFGRALKVDGKDSREMELTVESGTVRLGSVPLGRLPRF